MLTATDPEGTLYLVNTYDGEGRVVAQGDADGNQRTFSYEQGRTVYTDNEGRRTVFGVDDRFRVTSVENPDGTTANWRYDARNDVVAHVDEAGREERYAYDDAGNLASERDAAGNETRYTSTSTGQVASRTDALGRTWTYEYDGRGLLTRELRPDGTAMQYTYTSAGDLASATAPSGAASTYEYDGRGNVVAATDHLGHRTTFAYDAGNRLTSVVDPIDSTTTYEWDHADRLTAITDPMGARSTFAYDRNGNLRSATDAAGAVTTYEWDALSRVVRSVAPDGGVTTFSYDREDHLTSATDPEGATTQLLLDQAYRAAGVVDPNGARWEQELDATGIVTGTTDADGARTTVELDEVGRAVKTTDPTGAATSVAYDAVGRVASETDAAGAETRFEYDALDRLTRVTDPAGHVSELHYDVDGNLVGTVDRLGNPTLFEVDAAGQILSATDATGAVERYDYDAAGRVTAVVDADGGRTGFTYDAAGRMTAVTDAIGAQTRYAYDAVGRQVSTTDPLGAVTRVDYDAAGRVTRVVDALGAERVIAYDRAGRRTSTTDENGVVTAFAYDPVGRLARVVEGRDATAPADSDTNVVTAYAYSAAGRLTGITGPTGAVTGWEYDAAGRPTVEIGPAGERTETTYDAAGRIERQSNRLGLVAAFRYDQRGDVATLTRSDGDVTFEYDAEQRPIAMIDPVGVTGWIYDEVGRVREQLDANGQRLVHEYTAAGLTASTTLADGTVTRFSYDAAGQATRQSTPFGDVQYGYDAAGQRTQTQLPNGVVTSVAYDPVGQVTRVSHATPSADGSAVSAAPAASPASAPVPGGAAAPARVTAVASQAESCRSVDGYLASRTTPAAGPARECVKTGAYLDRRTLPAPAPAAPPGSSLTYEYTWNADGSVASRERTISAPETADDITAQSYRYDDLARLLESATDGGVVSRYGYDAAGNRTAWSSGDISVTATLDAAGRVVSTSEGATYEYDAAGARSAATVDGERTTFAHDPAGRLRGTATDQRQTSYAYDGLERRVQTSDTETFGTDDRTQAWDGLFPVGGASSRHGDSTMVRDAAGEPLVQSGPTGVSWLLGDMRDVTATADAGGVLNELVSFGDFGGTAFETPGWNAAVGYDRQPGDASLGLDEYYARSYDAGSASWLEPDSWRGSMTSPQSMNRYAYVENSPVAYSDSFGFARNRPGGGRVRRKPTNANRRYHSSIPPYVQMQLTKGQSRYNGGGQTSRGPSVGRPGSPSALALRSPGGYRNNPSALSQVRAPILRSQQLQSLRHQMTTMGCGQFDWGCRGTYSGRGEHISSLRVGIAGMVITPFRTGVPVASADRLSSFLESEQGRMIGAWMMGGSPSETRYGLNSAMTQDIRAHESTSLLRNDLVAELRRTGGHPNIGDIVGGYSAGSPNILNGNLWRDGWTFLTYPIASSADRTLMTLGTYSLQPSDVRTLSDHKVRVTWVASNRTTLGSMTRGLGDPSWWNQRVGPAGPLSAVTQRFEWTEELEW